MAPTIPGNNTLIVVPQVNQETDLIVTLAARIYNLGAIYSPVAPDKYRVQSPDTDDGVLVSASEFRQILSLVHSLKSRIRLW